MVDSAKKARWGKRLGWLAAILCFGSVAAALIAAIGAGQGAWHFRPAFTVLRYALFAGIAGMVLALPAMLLARRAQPRLALVNLVGLLLALGFVLFLGNQVRIARSVPGIHDITTNLNDPPQFQRLQVRSDNLETVPSGDRPELEALNPEERWKALHREAYRDIRPLRLNMSVADVIARAEQLALDRGWEVVQADPRQGTLEATDTSLFFRFKDDVALRARPDPINGGTIVDMRSVSRVGVSDVGVNARRIRSFLADLQRG